MFFKVTNDCFDKSENYQMTCLHLRAREREREGEREGEKEGGGELSAEILQNDRCFVAEGFEHLPPGEQ